MQFIRKYIIYVSALVITIMGVRYDFELDTAFIAFFMMLIVVALLCLGLIYSWLRKGDIKSKTVIMTLDICTVITVVYPLMMVFLFTSGSLYGFRLVESDNVIRSINKIGFPIFMITQFIALSTGASKRKDK